MCLFFSRGLERAAPGLEVPAWKAPTVFLFWLIGSHNSRHPATLRRLALHWGPSTVCPEAGWLWIRASGQPALGFWAIRFPLFC